MTPAATPARASVVQQFDVFLSYNGRDQAVVERIALRLKQAGIEPWLDRWSLTPGAKWQGELAAGLSASRTCAVFVGAHDLGAWERQEVDVALDRAAIEPAFRVFTVLLAGVADPFDPNCLPLFLRARTWVDFRRGHGHGRALQDLINAVKGVPFGPDIAVAPADDVAPYRGLRVFVEEDAPFFFGRDAEIQRLLEKLKSTRFLAVLGPSGSGKSSLVQAGLVPELRAGALAEVEDWHVVVLRPGAAPLTALAAQLAKLLPGRSMRATLDELALDPATLHLSVELALADRPPGDRVLVIVDQLEELFTLCSDERERRQLLATLLHATSMAGGRTVVIVTLRADFYVRCAGYPEFAQLITTQQMLVGPMEPDGLRQAIEEPARHVGLQLEQGLSDTILADVGAEPGGLPLLEHALLELWERRRGAMLTLEGYRQAGGVHGALAQRADKIFDGLSGDEQQIARRALLRLTQPGEGTEDTRRRATRAELSPVEGDDSFDVVLGRLVDARMLTTGRDETGQQVVDVSHEALIRGWPRLRGWIDADRAGLLIHHRLADAAREWDALSREPGALYRGARLAAAREWTPDHADHLSQLERDFLTASQAAEHSELEAARRSTRRLRALATGLAALTVIVAALAVFALHLRSSAQRKGAQVQRQASQATSAALTSAASPLLNSRPDIALVLGLEAYRASPRPEARGRVLAALMAVRDPGVPSILAGHTDLVSSVAFSPDGRMLASASADRSVRLWDVRARKPLGSRLLGHTGLVSSVAFSPDGRMLASASADRSVRLWDVRARKPLGSRLLGHTGLVSSVAFSPDGRMLASASADRTVRLWDVRARKPHGSRLLGHTGLVSSVAFSPDGRMLASASADKTVRLWDVRARQQLGAPLRGHTSRVTSVAFSPDGRMLVSASADRTVRMSDVRTRRQVGALTGETSAIYSVAFSPDGRILASAGDAAALRLSDVRSDEQLGPRLRGHSGLVSSVAFSPDGRTLASAGADKTVRLWDVRAREQLDARVTVTSVVYSMAFSPDERTMAFAGADNAVRLWDMRGRKGLGEPMTDHTGSIYSVAYSRNGRTLASASEDRTVRLWDVRARKRLGAPLTGHTGSVYSVAFSPDGRTLASASEDRMVRLWDVRARKRLGAPLTGHTGSVYSVAFSPDGRTLASASEDRMVRLWDVRARKRLGAPLTAHTGSVYSVAFSPDGRTLASASADRTIRLWDVRDRRQLGPPIAGVSAVYGVVFSRDGRTLVSASLDDVVRLWDARTHQHLRTLSTANTRSLKSKQFSRSPRILASASDDLAIRLWAGLLWRNLAELQARVCRLVGSSLSRAEWAQHAAGIRYRQSCP